MILISPDGSLVLDVQRRGKAVTMRVVEQDKRLRRPQHDSLLALFGEWEMLTEICPAIYSETHRVYLMGTSQSKKSDPATFCSIPAAIACVAATRGLVRRVKVATKREA